MTDYDKIKTFTIKGVIGESGLAERKERLIHELSSHMRDNGFIEVLDLTPDWKLGYDHSAEHYQFELRIYGVECDEPWKYAGLLDGKMILKSTANNKSEPSSQD